MAYSRRRRSTRRSTSRRSVSRRRSPARRSSRRYSGRSGGNTLRIVLEQPFGAGGTPQVLQEKKRTF